MTDDAEGIVSYLLDTMNGIDDTSKKRIPHNTRLAAARELLSRGYPPECDCAHRAASETEVVRPAAASLEQTTDNPEPSADDSARSEEEEAQIQEVMDKIRRIAEEADPSEFEEDESDGRKLDYSMWEIIDNLPEPVITEEQARIGAAQFHEAVERQMRWAESDVKIPTRKDHHNYDDG